MKPGRKADRRVGAKAAPGHTSRVTPEDSSVAISRGRGTEFGRLSVGGEPSAGRKPMSEAGEILQSYLGLLARLSGAASVSLYVPPGDRAARARSSSTTAVSDPLPELANADAAAELHRRLGADETAHGVRCPAATPRACSTGIPLRWSPSRSEEETGGPERRKRDGRPAELTAWIGLRFDQDDADRERDPLWFADRRRHAPRRGLVEAASSAWPPPSPPTPAPSRGSCSTRSPSCPSGPISRRSWRRRWPTSRRRRCPAVLLLLGPDDFGWVNERLDRRSGRPGPARDRHRAAGGLRSHDHVARYGGAIFSVILLDTTLDDGRMVAENVVRRLARPPVPRGHPAPGVQRRPGGGRARRARGRSRS